MQVEERDILEDVCHGVYIFMEITYARTWWLTQGGSLLEGGTLAKDYGTCSVNHCSRIWLILTQHFTVPHTCTAKEERSKHFVRSIHKLVVLGYLHAEMCVLLTSDNMRLEPI